MDRLKFFLWRIRLWREMRRINVYGWAFTESFVDYFRDDYSPRDALAEDMTYLDA